MDCSTTAPAKQRQRRGEGAGSPAKEGTFVKAGFTELMGIPGTPQRRTSLDGPKNGASAAAVQHLQRHTWCHFWELWTGSLSC